MIWNARRTQMHARNPSFVFKQPQNPSSCTVPKRSSAREWGELRQTSHRASARSWVAQAGGRSMTIGAHVSELLLPHAHEDVKVGDSVFFVRKDQTVEAAVTKRQGTPSA